MDSTKKNPIISRYRGMLTMQDMYMPIDLIQICNRDTDHFRMLCRNNSIYRRPINNKKAQNGAK